MKRLVFLLILSVAVPSCYEYYGDVDILGHNCKVYIKNGQHFVKIDGKYYPYVTGNRHDDGALGLPMGNGLE